jgi:hypothetical protein
MLRLELETLDPHENPAYFFRAQGKIEILRTHLSEEYIDRLGVEYQQVGKTHG